ncbi:MULTISPECIES: hypothetical protein [Glutamicibacter]|uniref:WXG100 family type VII secretion target n=1 Tax=Glutamicibacter halophytocola TaxID=1933880 RepID=A0A5B8IW81_9MICC|nr:MULTISPECIES: hypothetical protein [Glutamicibacter]MBF6670684.1 hypothetical protein [Glutamicibacter sp. FBE19]QDY66417.1 hypothetical protein FQA45_08820 [Glutamicibacter halophytocola]UUX58524.1 hypothetical protein NUH22_14660 [Glutamicibacter halophytocola]
MMFSATLDSMAFQLDDAQKTTRFAITQLDSIGSLTWKSAAGRAFYDRVLELSTWLEQLNRELAEAESYVGAATREIQELELQILQQKLAS